MLSKDKTKRTYGYSAKDYAKFKKHFGVSPNAYKKLQSKTTKSNKQTNINL